MARHLEAGRLVTVEVPATGANLGPGFDCFGLALDWYERVRLEVLSAGYHIEQVIPLPQLPYFPYHIIEAKRH